MAELMRMPEVAAGAADALLTEWLVAAGAEVTAGDVVAVIETDKAQVEIQAESSGVVLRLLVEESHQVDVGSPIALLGDAAEGEQDLTELLATLGVSSCAAPVAAPPGRRDEPESVVDTGANRRPDKQSDGQPAPDAVPTRRFISPIARRLLREAGIDGADIVGTGPGGRVIRRDVQERIAAHLQVGPVTAPPVGTTSPADPQIATGSEQGVERREHSRVRRLIARRLTESKQTVPHFYVKRSARIDELVRLRRELNEGSGRKISVNDFVLRAAAEALIAVPDANVVWTDEAMLHHERADIAVAVASQRGLVTPVLRSVERMSLGTISRHVRDFVERADAGTLKQGDLEGGTLSVTNLGMFGVEEFSAIINPPQSAILAVGAASPQAVVVDGAVEIGTTMSLVLSADHRAIDGALAAEWMKALVDALENPYLLLV